MSVVGKGRVERKRKTVRRVIILTEWAELLGYSDQTVRKNIRLYEAEGYTYDDKDIFSVLLFFKWLIDNNQADNMKLPKVWKGLL